ncbi:MAG: hypothetical protein JSR34_09535 [Proteobacteria bacterium]|nr:hypothetical protein [Pseudomonadota bacterium]
MRASLLVVVVAALTACAEPASTPAPAIPEGTSAVDSTVADTPSPVPAFHGTGVNWKIDLQADRGARHEARLYESGHWTNANLVLDRGAPGDAASQFDFHGTWYLPAGDTPLQVQMQRGACRDVSGRRRAWSVRVVAADVAELHGCGEIAPH